MKKKLIRIICSAILIVAGAVVGFLYLPVSMKLTGTDKSQQVEDIRQLAKTVLPVSTEKYFNGEVPDDFVPYTLQEVVSLNSTATSVLKNVYTELDRQLEVQFEKESALYHSIGTLRSDTISLVNDRKILTETTWTFDFEAYISKDKLLIKYNQWDYDILVHDKNRQETEADTIRSQALAAIHKNYGKWLDIPSLENVSEDSLKAQADLSNDPEKELYILMNSYAIANEYTEELYKVNDANYDSMSSFFDCLIHNFSDFKPCDYIRIQLPSDSHSIFKQFEGGNGFIYGECYYLPYYKNDREYIVDISGNKVHNDISELWKRFYANSGEMRICFNKDNTIIYENYTSYINSANVTCLAKLKDIGTTKINPPKEKKSLLDVFYNPIEYTYELDKRGE